MKKRAAVILTGMMVSAMFLSACGKNDATEAANESAEVEKEGNGETEETEGQDQEEASDAEDTGNSEDAQDSEESKEPAPKVGVLFPDEDQWIRDSQAMKAKLEEEGYEPVIMNAEDDAALQAEQIQELVDEQAAALVIAPVDAYALTEVLDHARENSIPVFSYDVLIRDTAAVNYYTTYDRRVIGNEIGKKIAELKELDKAREEKRTLTIEFLMGSPDDVDALFLYNGIMEILQPYLDDGTLICRSGKVSFDDTSIMRWSSTLADNRIKSILSEFYADEMTPDIICTSSDEFTYGVTEALKDQGIQPWDENWPLITGMGSKAEAVRNVAEGELAFTVFMDREELAQTCMKMVVDYLSGEDPEVKDYSHYDNGVKIIGTDTCEAQFIDQDNYQILIDNGTYSEDEIEPEVIPTPIIEDTETEGEEAAVVPEDKADDEEASVFEEEADDGEASVPEEKADDGEAPVSEEKPDEEPSVSEKGEQVERKM